MSSIQSILNRSKDIRLLCNRLSSLNIVKPATHKNLLCATSAFQPKLFTAGIHSTVPRYDLMEFFEDKKHWGKTEVRCGRSWRLDELRIKSNSDLHKLWYVLLKEKNMLLTMEHECEQAYEAFPNPERIDKVQESMDNLETVVRERNKAYHMLETGRDGERPMYTETSRIGLEYQYRASEHFIPRKYNRNFNLNSYNKYNPDRDVTTFLRFYKEKHLRHRQRARNRDKNHVRKLLSKFPNLDRDLVQREYPDVDVKSLEYNGYTRGHYAPKIDEST